MQSTDIVV